MILTFILTLVVCSQILNNPRPQGTLPVISLFGVDAVYYYFLCGSIVLFVQFLFLIIGRLQFLLHSQSLVHRAILYAIHATALISNILLLMMAVVDVHSHFLIHVIVVYFSIHRIVNAFSVYSGFRAIILETTANAKRSR